MEFKPVVTERYEFEYQDILSKALFRIFGLSGCLRKNKIAIFSINWFAKSWTLSSEKFIEENKTVVTEKNEFEHRDKPKLIAGLKISDLSGF